MSEEAARYYRALEIASKYGAMEMADYGNLWSWETRQVKLEWFLLAEMEDSQRQYLAGLWHAEANRGMWGTVMIVPCWAGLAYALHEALENLHWTPELTIILSLIAAGLMMKAYRSPSWIRARRIAQALETFGRTNGSFRA
jgi:hypothetical protein